MARFKNKISPGVVFGIVTALLLIGGGIFLAGLSSAGISHRADRNAAGTVATAHDESVEKREEDTTSASENTAGESKKKQRGRIKVENMVFEASGIYPQKKKLKLSYEGDGEPRYFSENDSVTVEEGTVHVSPNYCGKTRITIILPETEQYASASGQMTVVVRKPENEITASDIEQDFSDLAQVIDLNAKARSRAELTYSTNSDKVTVSEGKINIAPGFHGVVKITIHAQASGIYTESTKTILLNVVSGTASKLYETAKSQIGVSGQGKNNTIYGEYTGANRQAWCASFVSWCADQAGVRSLKPPAMSIIPKSASTLAMCSYSNSYHVWGEQALTNMKQGDVIFFSKMSKRYEYQGKKVVCHVGIVESTDPSSRKVTVVEGNSTGDRVCRHIYYPDRDTGRIGKRYFCGYISIK